MVRPELLALAAALCWAIGSLFSARAASRMGTIGFNRWRLVFACSVLWLAVGIGGYWSPLAWPDVLLLSLSGLVGICVGDTALFACMNRLGPRRSGVLFACHALFSALVAWWLLGERPSRGGLLRLLLALLGVALVLKTPEMDWPWPSSLLDYLALLGGASFALVNVLLRKLAYVPDSDRTSAMFAGGMLVTAVAAVIGVPLGVVSVPTDLSWWPHALGLSLLLLAANASLQYGAARLPASTTALVMLSEIVFAALSSVALGASELSERKLFGGALIVLAAFLATMPTPSQEPPL